MAELEKGFGWDDEIEKESEFELLPEGDYDFRITGFERGRHGGSGKLPACNKAMITLCVSSQSDSTMLKHNLFLHEKTEGLLSAFFLSIGQKKHGEKLKMDWGKVVGSTGRCSLIVHEWTSDSGEKRQSNNIKKFYEKVETVPAKGYTAGSF